jgi:hypothetical protein
MHTLTLTSISHREQQDQEHAQQALRAFWQTEIEPASAWDYFDEYYNLDYVIDCNLEYTACRVMVACGGPNIYINTWDKCVELYWWTESGKAYLPGYVCDYIDEYFSEIYESQRGCF